ncbi:hypothetical protein CABS03_04368, partial [Colletotrichum abscissum]
HHLQEPDRVVCSGVHLLKLAQDVETLITTANVQLVDITSDSIDLYDLYENGVVTGSGEYKFDMVIFALGFDAGTGALSEIDAKGSQGRSLKKCWTSKVDTFAGTLIPGFPDMFSANYRDFLVNEKPNRLMYDFWAKKARPRVKNPAKAALLIPKKAPFAFRTKRSSLKCPNLFIVYGPQAPTAFSNRPPFLESQVNMITELLQKLQKKGIKSIKAQRDIEEKWKQAIQATNSKTLMPLTDT